MQLQRSAKPLLWLIVGMPLPVSMCSVVQSHRGANKPGLPAYVAVPFAANINLVPGYNGAAWLLWAPR